MLQDGFHFAALLLLTLAVLKIAAAWALHNGHNSLGRGIDWFFSPA